jgi:hypothetical protein
MSPRRETEPALAAPGLIGPVSILNQPISGPRSSRRSRNRPYSHVHLEIDLKPESADPAGVPLLERLAGVLKEREITETGTLILLAAATLHALSSQRFRRVDHWEVTPGGWLPPPTSGAAPDGEEPVGHLIDALESDSGAAVGSARSFSARLSDRSGARVDVIVRRVHRERRHALSLDLWGSWTPAAVKELKGSLSERLPLARSTMTKYQYL